MNKQALLRCMKTAPENSIRVICFPYAGGAASIFNSWLNFLPDCVELIVAQLPGRDDLYAMPFATNFDSLVKLLCDEIFILPEKTDIVFGHSLGALIGLEVARELRRRNHRNIKHLILSAANPPHLETSFEDKINLSNYEFLKYMKTLGGIPNEALLNQELIDIALPRLRADFTLGDTYEYYQERPLDCYFTVLGGKDDVAVNAATLKEWEFYSSKKVDLHIFQGDHFYIQQHQKAFYAILIDIITRHKTAVDSL